MPTHGTRLLTVRKSIFRFAQLSLTGQIYKWVSGHIGPFISINTQFISISFKPL